MSSMCLNDLVWSVTFVTKRHWLLPGTVSTLLPLLVAAAKTEPLAITLYKHPRYRQHKPEPVASFDTRGKPLRPTQPWDGIPAEWACLLHDDLQAINRAIHERRAARGITMAALRKADRRFSRKPECVPRDSLT